MSGNRTPVERVIDRLFDTEIDRRGGPLGFLVRVVRAVYLSYREFRHDLCWERAATLSFATVLSLLPIAVLFANLLSVPKVTDGLKNFVLEQFIPWLLPRIDQATLGKVTKIIEEFMQPQNFELGTGSNVVAVVALIVAGVGLLVSAERIFSLVWKVRSSRNYFQKFVAFWMILTTSPLLIALSLYVSSNLSAAFDVSHTFIKTLYTTLIPVFVSCVAFTFLFFFLPHTKVRAIPAFVGGCVTGILWEAMKGGFVYYFRRAAELKDYYGASFWLVPFFLVFIYATWLILLWGSELACTMQNYTTQLREFQMHQRRRDAGHHSAIYLGLNLLGRIMHSYAVGKPIPTVEAVAEELEIYREEFQPVLAHLTGDGVLTEDSGTPGRYVPARAPETISLRDVTAGLLAVGSRDEVDCHSGDQDPAAALLTRARASFLGSFEGLSLLGLADPSAADLSVGGGVDSVAHAGADVKPQVSPADGIG